MALILFLQTEKCTQKEQNLELICDLGINEIYWKNRIQGHKQKSMKNCIVNQTCRANYGI